MALEDPGYCQWCLETQKPSAKMAAFRQYLESRQTQESGSSGQKPAAGPASSRPRARGATKRDYNMSADADMGEEDDDEWSTIGSRATSPTTGSAGQPSPTECVASMTSLLSQALAQADQHPRATPKFQQLTQTLREHWAEVTLSMPTTSELTAWTRKDHLLMVMARKSADQMRDI